MPLTDGTLNSIGGSLDTLLAFASLHSADPGTTGINETTAARVAVTWTVDADGDLTLTAPLDFTGGASGGPVAYVGFFSASSGGTFRGSYALSGDAAFNAAGEYTVTNVTISGTAG